MFKFSLPPSFGRWDNKKTPAYAEYVEIHQKHNMKFLAFFSVVASRQISPHFRMQRYHFFGNIQKNPSR